MSCEDQSLVRKSLKSVIGRSANWSETAEDCVCFANGSRGRLLLGIEDGEDLPPEGQSIPLDLPGQVQKRIAELTVNVQVLPRIVAAHNGGEYLEVLVQRSASVASTTDGRYYLRVGDSCRPVVGDEVLRLADERPGWAWEAMDSSLSAQALDAGRVLPHWHADSC